MTKKVAFACDHRGFDLKPQIFDFLKKKKYEIIDCGTFSPDSTDYPDYMFKAAELVSQGECEKAVGVCYTGIGSSIAANKVHGVRAALVHTVKEAELSRAHNDSNMLILGSGFLDSVIVPQILETWFGTSFEGGRHGERVNKIKTYEQKHG
ncbi:MAG: ribose 5-phosphate isomerase B [Candidatus Omnitrophica bacterium]|nr:ribose 5-phosphate isomerase B [Candidatus Omnitrophota bacterium]